MTIKRQWMLLLILSAIISVGVNSFVLSSLINRYFVDYTTENYNKHLTQIMELSKRVIMEKSYSRQQIANQLEAQLNDPIIRIKLYDVNGQLLADISNESYRMNGMMRNRMMNRMMGPPSEEIDSAEITDAGVLLGKLNITRYSSVGNSLTTRSFQIALIGNSILSFGLVLIFMILVGAIVSKKMSKDLMHTASLAFNIDLGNQLEIKLSKVREIRIIQQSLNTLQSRLKLKQTSRKRLVDELVHQTRTPLTILKTHLEGLEDGIITMTPEEIKTCEIQIENITSIITNMSCMIDAEKEMDTIKLEEFDLYQLLKQIIGGLNVQFDKKQIELFLSSNQRVICKTDKYKLSQSIYNVLTNAYKFTEPNGKVSIGYEEAEEDIIIVIEDTGTGIGDEDKKHMFDAYYRGYNTSNISGEGIGLYVVKENLNKIHGTIRVESEIGKGSKFLIKFPKIVKE